MSRGTGAFVYFVDAPEAAVTKIGFTSHPVEQRFRSLQSGSPIALELVAWGLGGREYERAFHEFFAASWSHGEWFHRTLELGSAVRRVGWGSDLSQVIDPSKYVTGIFAAHVMAGHDTERVRRLDPAYVPAWARPE